MDNSQPEKKAKSPKPTAHAALRVRKETRKKVVTELAKVNRKDFGRRVRTDEYLLLAISLIRSEHIHSLQEASLSNADRLERDYRAYVAQHGSISKDEYLGRRLRGELKEGTETASNVTPMTEAR